MTKKHFIVLADYLRQAAAQGLPFEQYQLEVLAAFCTQFNPRFNRKLWLDYIAGRCGPNGGKVKEAK